MNESNESGSGNHGEPNLIRNALTKSPLTPRFQKGEKFRLAKPPFDKGGSKEIL